MKIQYIAVVFVIIILPIAMVMSSYIGTQIDTITLQTKYDTKLTEATYDAIKSFQINTVNNRYSTVSDSKIRDIEASVNTFYNSLSNNEYMSKEELQVFVPALVYTLYDGYYIYTKYDNMYPEKAGTIYTDTKKANANYGLKPYIYYTCRYRNGNATEFVVNYTLDNAITIYGTFSGKYVTLSGYLINPDSVSIINYGNTPARWKLKYKNNDEAEVIVGPELLREHLAFADESKGDYDYLIYNGQKIYYDKDNNIYFTYQSYAKQYITNSKSNEEMRNYLVARTYGGRLHSTSAFEYYYNAKKFSEKVAELTKGITQANAIDENGSQVKFEVDTGTDKIFVANADNDPLMSGSTFNENRMQVIKKSIESNLVAAIANYNMYSSNSYDFSLPILKETDWEKITNNVSVISFLQGLPIGYKYYNNYCVLTNNSNEETVKKENIYIITRNSETKEREYHLVGCKHLLAGSTDSIIAAYSNLTFLRQTVRIAENDYRYFYPQNINGETITACYNCIVNSTDVYTTEQILKGKITEKNIDTGEEEQKYNTGNSRFKSIRELYIKALARERNDLYQSNMNSINHEQNEQIDETTDNKKITIIGQTSMMNEGNTQQLTAKIWLGPITAKWSSSNSNVARVDTNGKVTAVREGTAIITAKYDGYTDGTYQITVQKEKVQTITLDKYELTMKPGETEKINVTKIEPESAVDQRIRWSSSDTSIARVDSNGNIKAVKAGTVTITAEAVDGGGASASCIVSVEQKVTNIRLNLESLKMNVGDTYTLKATTEPDNLSSGELTWNSSDSSIVTVDANGKVTAKKLGRVTITVKAENGIEARCTVDVISKVKNITLNPTDIVLHAGETKNITATINPSNASNKSLTWTSSNNSIAQVDQRGKVTAKAIGEVTITAKSNDGSNVSAKCRVNVIGKYRAENATNNGFYIYDNTNGREKQTTYGNRPYNVTFHPGNSNVTLKVNTSYKDGKILITYTIKNKGNASSTYKVATDCDTKFQDNDRAPIKYENNQIIVTGSSTNMYIQFITPVTGVWIGHYSNRTSYRYCDYTYNQTCNRCR